MITITWVHAEFIPNFQEAWWQSRAKQRWSWLATVRRCRVKASSLASRLLLHGRLVVLHNTASLQYTVKKSLKSGGTVWEFMSNHFVSPLYFCRHTVTYSLSPTCIAILPALPSTWPRLQWSYTYSVTSHCWTLCQRLVSPWITVILRRWGLASIPQWIF